MRYNCFLINLARYEVDGYTLNAFDFILKQVDYNGFFAIKRDRICKELKHRNPDSFINMKTNNEFVRLNVSRISYVEVKSHDLIYHAGTDSIASRNILKNIAQ